MKIIDPSVSFVNPPAEVNPFKLIEITGRTCYKSEDRMTPESSIKFVRGIISRGHEAVLEQANFIFLMNEKTYLNVQSKLNMLEIYNDYRHFFKFTCVPDKYGRRYVMSGNLRAWRDLFRQNFMIPFYMEKFITDYPDLFPEWQDHRCFTVPTYKEVDPVLRNADRYCFEQIRVEELKPGVEFSTHFRQAVRFVCDRGISHELVRHREASFCQESTRYCNYSKEGFGHELTVIRPNFFEEGNIPYRMWKNICEKTESCYIGMTDALRYPPQMARDVLTNSLKTEVIMTMNFNGWKRFLKLRTGAGAHPQMIQVAEMLQTMFIDKFPRYFAEGGIYNEP